MNASLALPLLLVLTSFAQAQTALEELEQKIRRPPGAAPAEAAAEPGYLGVIADDRQDRGAGLRIVEVTSGSPAEAAGLQAGDLITGVNGRDVPTMDDMAAAIEPLPVGAEVAFQISRDGETSDVVVTLGRRPAGSARRLPQFGRVRTPAADDGSPAELESQGGPLLGIRTQTVNEEIRARLGLPEATGVLVVARVIGSPAEQAGIPLDAVIVAADGVRVVSSTQLAQAISQAGAGARLALTYIVGGKEVEAEVVLGGAEAPAPIDEDRPPPDPAGEVISPVETDANDRIERLERRIRELEQRLGELEEALERSRAQGD